MTTINLTPAEIQSGLSRQRYAELLIAQLPANHDGRNTWLMNYGTGDEAQDLRRKRGLSFDQHYQASVERAVTPELKQRLEWALTVYAGAAEGTPGAQVHNVLVECRDKLFGAPAAHERGPA